MTNPKNGLNLVADIGGTNTRVALAKGNEVMPQTIRRYSNRNFPDFETVLRQHANEEGYSESRAACVAVAGPVRNGRAIMTNLDWTIDEATVVRATSAENVAILNDLQAQGHAIGFLDQSTLRPILYGQEIVTKASRLVIGVGTGFNFAPVLDTLEQRLVAPSEAGHATLPIRTEEELRLSQFVSTTNGYPTVEDVLSGPGLERVYLFFAQRNGTSTEKTAAEIMAACNDKSDPIALEATRAFVSILGTVCGNLSLQSLPFGGVFLVGGVSRAFAPFLVDLGFDHAFRDRGRFTEFMLNFAVNVVEDDYAALTGCAAFISNTKGTANS